jgi:phosphotransferase system enzyme I (PtsI)
MAFCRDALNRGQGTIATATSIPLETIIAGLLTCSLPAFATAARKSFQRGVGRGYADVVVERPAICGERSHRGIAVSGGVAHARILVIGQPRRLIERTPVSDDRLDFELDRLNTALIQTRQDIQAVKEQVAAAMGAQEAGLFEAHLLVIEDSTLLDEVVRKIRLEKICAEAAFHEVSEKYVAALEAIDDGYLRERAADIRDVTGRVLDHLLGVGEQRDLRRLSEPCIVVAHDLPPSTTAVLDRQHVLGFATEAGGQTSHTAIMARKLGIPAIVGLGPLLDAVRDGEYALLDGHGGVLTVNPTDQTLFAYGQLKQRRAQFEEKLALLREQPAVTLDGHRITLAANIDGPEDMAAVQASGAEGVGLFRTEFLFLNRRMPPDEDEQFEAYRTVASKTGAGATAVLRTLDLGGDKLPGALARTGEPNPFLGWRAIRISLEQPAMFRSQLRAILRASAYGRVRLLYPMISSLEELRAANGLLAKCREELRAEGVPFDESMPVGAMIEIPAAAIVADALAREVNFFSIGTNDLTGYTLAVDRLNERVAHLYRPTHPAIVRMIRMTVDAAAKHGREVAVCGEMAGEPGLVPLLIGLGIHELSVTPAMIPQVKFLLRRLKLSEAKPLADFALGCESALEIHSRSVALARQIAPNLFGGS